MRHAILLTVTMTIVAACATPQPMETGGKQVARADTSPAPWTAYRAFNFEAAAVDISIADTPKLREIVAYLESNPSLDVGIDGTLAAEGGSAADRSLTNRRAAAVRRALMDTGAGVPSYKIVMGPFAQSTRERRGQIQVLVGPRTGSLKTELASR